MKTICDLKEGDKVWVYDHGKVRERTVKKIEFLQDERGGWDLHISLTRCIPYKLYAGYGTLEEAKKYFEQWNKNYGYFYAASQKIWTDKGEMKNWLVEVSNTHRRLYHRYARRARREESALYKMTKVIEELQ